MAEFEVLEGKRRPSVRETVAWHLRRLRGMDMWDNVLFTDEDGATRLGTVLDHERDIQDSEDGTVRIGGYGEALRIPVQSIIRVTVRKAEQISAKTTPTSGREIDEGRECFYVDPLGREVRRGVGTVFGGRQEAGGERVTDGHGKMVGRVGGHGRSGVNGQVSGRDDNVVYARFRKEM